MGIFAAMEKMPLFHGLDREQIQELFRHSGAQRRTYTRGEMVLRAGERTSRLGLLLSGSVHVIREDFWGGRTIVGVVEAGDVFAESFALAGEPLEVSVFSPGEAEVLFLDAEAAGVYSGRFTVNLLALMAGKNLALTRKMGHMARKTTREKLLSYLSAQAIRAGDASFDIPFDRQQLADFLAVDRSAMSAALGKLRDEGILEFRKNHFHLLRRHPEEMGEEELGC